MHELSELYKTQMKVVALQEIRWAGNGVISKNDFQLFYSGTQQSRKAGMRFYVKKEIAKYIIGFEAVNEKICKLRIKGKYRNITIILGDLNAKLGREEIYSNISGKYTLHNVTSPNGELLVEFIIANNMVIMSTQFQHKEIHKGTWRAAEHNTVNQIDHVIINASKKDLTEDVRTMREPNLDSDLPC
ncbi:hypothetical protein B7P43_G12954 [Cryptotermes secundus]|uniref:Endonuclease/exonuclease/phosphatase domain-containing protein n=1 Tax=Cryptotermes secundus TaxID=105785 RepID=A0A2J7QFT8_9NEOP|nr:hypothetical protein B7P43_G12954 [Cryptotermes secundus]